ncbi:hypothetical protein [Microcoleus sp. A006_D1]|uniref:hypothetical protein n=1 Tax=Microcoleus sp. A006_D1 TaxID=3055267 RepID=UPI003FA5DE8F
MSSWGGCCERSLYKTRSRVETITTYSTGTINKLKKVETTIPPAIAFPSGDWLHLHLQD